MLAIKKNSRANLVQNFFQYAFVLCVVLNMQSIWMHTPSLTWASKTIKLIMGFSVVGGVLAKGRIPRKKIKLCITSVFFLTGYAGLLYLVDPLKNSTIFTAFIQLLAIVVYCGLVEDSVDETLRKYTNIVLVIAVVSLLLWIFGSLMGYIKPTGFLYTTWTGNDSIKRVNNYYGIYFETQTAKMFGLSAIKVIRNTAIFTEAPMASFVFSIAFLSELLFVEKANKKRCMILAFAVISTISITGYTVLIIALGLKFIFTKSKSIGSYSFKIIAIPVVFAVGLVVLSFLIEYKLATISGSTRIDDFVAGYKAWIGSPIFGNGYGNAESYKNYMSSFRRNNLGFSNSPMMILAFGGIYLFAPYLVAVVSGFTRMVKRKLQGKLVFYLVFLYAFMITVVPFQMLTFYLFIALFGEGKRGETGNVH